MQKRIRLECASWYRRDDGVVQIIGKNGRTTILNKAYSEVWDKIGYEIESGDLCNEMKDVMSEELIMHILDEFINKNMITVTSEADNFDMLFN